MIGVGGARDLIRRAGLGEVLAPPAVLIELGAEPFPALEYPLELVAQRGVAHLRWRCGLSRKSRCPQVRASGWAATVCQS